MEPYRHIGTYRLFDATPKGTEFFIDIFSNPFEDFGDIKIKYQYFKYDIRWID